MSAHTKTLEEKIAAVVRLLASDRDGEVIAAVNALKRTLASAGTDINGLALGIENLGKRSRRRSGTPPCSTPRTDCMAAMIFAAPTANRPGKRSRCSASAT
jgi:hypothetical protein